LTLDDLSRYPPRNTKEDTEPIEERLAEWKMEVGMSLNALVRLPLSNSRTNEDGLVKQSLFSSGRTTQKPQQRQKHILVVQAKGKKGMQARQFQRSPPPSLPKIEDDGNPKFVIFIRMANVCSLYLSLSLDYYFF
jgi:hypothetical protein